MGVQDRDWYWDAQGRSSDSPFLRSSRSGRSHAYSKKLIILVLAAIGATALARFVATSALQWRTPHAAEALSRDEQEALRRAEQAQREEELRQSQLQIELHQQAEAHRRATAQSRRREESAATSEAAERERKARAWAKYFQPAPHCQESATVACANAYIRAKRAFEDEYSRGRL
jgi:uncharacterized membrane protein